MQKINLNIKSRFAFYFVVSISIVFLFIQSSSFIIVNSQNKQQWYKVISPFLYSRQYDTVFPSSTILPYNDYDSEDASGTRSFLIHNLHIDSGVFISDHYNGDIGEASSNGLLFREKYKVEKNKKLESIEKYIAYVKNNRNYKYINDISQVEDNMINIASSSSILIDQSNVFHLNKQKFIIIAEDGDITINANINTNRSSSIAFITKKKLIFNELVSEANAIFLAKETIVKERPAYSNDGLKIYGNLISVDPLQNERTRQDNQRPSLFIVFSPEMYTSLLPYFSINSYDWQYIEQ